MKNKIVLKQHFSSASPEILDPCSSWKLEGNSDLVCFVGIVMLAFFGLCLLSKLGNYINICIFSLVLTHSQAHLQDKDLKPYVYFKLFFFTRVDFSFYFL